MARGGIPAGRADRRRRDAVYQNDTGLCHCFGACLCIGKGRAFFALPLGILQGSITLFAGVIAPVLSDKMIDNLSFIGSVLIFCVGINLCFGKKIKVGNLLPALVIAVLAALIPAL